MKAILILLTLLILSVSTTLASTVTVALPGLEGPIPYPNGKTESFDSGMNFKNINEVRLYCNGTIIPGVGCGDGVELPVYPYFDWPTQISFFMDTDPGCWAIFIGPYNGTFSEEKSFKGYGGATWDFLLDGQADISVNLAPLIVIGGVMLVPPQGSISEASMTIEGTVIDILRPAAGDYLAASSTYTVLWQDYRSQPNCPGSYLLDYSIDGGGSWIPIDVNAIEGNCSYDWFVPDANSQQCIIRITDANDPNISDFSGQFTIYQCQRTLFGDLNSDCYIDFIDIAILAQNWLNCGNPYDPKCQ